MQTQPEGSTCIEPWIPGANFETSLALLQEAEWVSIAAYRRFGSTTPADPTVGTWMATVMSPYMEPELGPFIGV